MMNPIPEGFHTVTPHILIDGAGAALPFYEKALGATAMGRMDMPGTDKVMHAMMRVGSSIVFLADPHPDTGQKGADGETSPVNFYVYVEDVDQAYTDAIEGGMTGRAEPEDMFWGDRTAEAKDPYGIVWTFATHIQDVTEEEMQQAMKSFASETRQDP